MQRRNFLKGLFGAIAATAAASVPTLAKKVDSTFTLEDIAFRCSGNSNLWYLKKGCWLDNELNEILGKRVVDRKYLYGSHSYAGRPAHHLAKVAKIAYSPASFTSE